MGANQDFKRLAKEMAEKARAQREKAAKAARTRENGEDDTQEAPNRQPKDLRAKKDLPAGSDRK